MLSGTTPCVFSSAWCVCKPDLSMLSSQDAQQSAPGLTTQLVVLDAKDAMSADGGVWREVQGATSSSEEAVGPVRQSEGGGPHGGLPLLPQAGAQAAQVPPRQAHALLTTTCPLQILKSSPMQQTLSRIRHSPFQDDVCLWPQGKRLRICAKG